MTITFPMSTEVEAGFSYDTAEVQLVTPSIQIKPAPVVEYECKCMLAFVGRCPTQLR
jgi:hypothetical protein